MTLRRHGKTASSAATLWRKASDPNNPKKRVKTYLLFGQSNASAQGEYTDLPVALQGEQVGSWLTSGTSSSAQPRDCFEQMIPGFNTAPNPNIALNYPFTTYAAMNGNNRHGLEVTLSNDLKAKYGEDIYAIKLAFGGTTLSEDAGLDWSTLTQENLGDLYKDSLLSAVKCLCDQGLAPDWLGAVWVQGEADRSRGVLADDYQEAERLLVSELRREVGVAGLPFVSFLLPSFAVDNANVNAAKTANAGAINNYTALAGGATHVGDLIHYDSASLQDMGTRAAMVL